MENLQLLNDEQIELILEVVKRDYIEPAIAKKRIDIENSDEYLAVKAKVKAVLDAIKAVAISDPTIKGVEGDYSDWKLRRLTYDNMSTKYQVNDYSIHSNIGTDIRTTLLLTPIDSVDNIIKNIVLPLINVDKYIIDIDECDIDV